MTIVDFYNKEQTDALLDDKADVSSVGKETDAPSASGSLWARIKYVLAHWLTADTEQTVSAKKTFSVSPEVPTAPATPESAINAVYANDATEGVNNIVHKTGNEKIAGTKTFGKNSLYSSATGTNAMFNKLESVELGVAPETPANYYGRLNVIDKNNATLGDFETSVRTNGDTYSGIVVHNKNNNITFANSITVFSLKNDKNNSYGTLAIQRPFNANNTTDIVTIDTLIQALRYYGLIQ